MRLPSPIPFAAIVAAVMPAVVLAAPTPRAAVSSASGSDLGRMLGEAGVGVNGTKAAEDPDFQPCIPNRRCVGTALPYQPRLSSDTSCKLSIYNHHGIAANQPIHGYESPEMHNPHPNQPPKEYHHHHDAIWNEGSSRSPTEDNRLFVGLPRHYMGASTPLNPLCGATVTLQLRLPGAQWGWMTSVQGTVKDECVTCLAGNIMVSAELWKELTRDMDFTGPLGSVGGVTWWVE